MSAPLLQLHGVRKAYGTRLLFAIGNLRIDAGGAYVLTGPNGSGKTTLMRMLAGLDADADGGLDFRGTPASFPMFPDRLRRAIVYVHQHPYLFHTSLRHNLEYGLKRRGMPPAERAPPPSPIISTSRGRGWNSRNAIMQRV